MSEVKLFSGRASRYLAKKIASFYGQPLGKNSVHTFSDSEIQVQIHESVRGSYVFLIQSTFSSAENILELLLLMDAAKRASAGYITAVIPYFGYARQDRKDKPRVAIGAKLIANILIAAGADRIMTMDLHADQIQGFFDIPVDHLQGDAIFIPYLREHKDMSNIIFASPDVGGVKRARNYAKYFKTELVICDKHREKANEVSSMTVIGNVEGADVILVDDLIDTAGTLCRAAELLVRKGAKSVSAICTHPVLSGPAYERLANSKLKELIVCDTLPIKKALPNLTVLSVSQLFSQAIRHVHENKSIEQLYVRARKRESSL